jgi:nucleoside-diphosphate-sugar epimerase
MKALVTGGTGFLGRHLVERLVLEGDEVWVLGRDGAALADLRRFGARTVGGDLRRLPSLAEAVEGKDVVFHCAGKVEASGRWVDFLEVNVLGTERLIQASLERGVRRFVHVSSIGVYPERPAGSVITEDEGYDTNTGRGGYTRSKIMADQLAFWYARERAAPITVIRPATIYGPGGKNNLVRVGVKKGRLNVIFGDGANLMPLVYVDNVVDALVLAARRPEAVGRAYNVVDDDRVTQRDYLTRMGAALGRSQTTVYLPMPSVKLLASGADLAKAALRGGRRSPQDMFSRISRSLQSVRYDTSRAESELGWKPRVGFEEALRRLARSHPGG